MVCTANIKCMSRKCVYTVFIVTTEATTINYVTVCFTNMVIPLDIVLITVAS